MSRLGAGAAYALQQLAVGHDAHAHAGAQRHQHHIAAAHGGARHRLCQRRAVGVVAEPAGKPQPRRHHVAHGYVEPTQIVRPHHHAAAAVAGAGGADADAGAVRRRDARPGHGQLRRPADVRHHRFCAALRAGGYADLRHDVLRFIHHTGGNIALLACAGPMGIGAIDYAINGGIQPSRVVVVDIDDKRLAQVQKLLPVELAASKGIELVYVNTKGMSDPVQKLRALTGDVGFDDIFVYAAVPAVVEMADELLAEDGCLNFFAGPTDKNFKVPFNFYNVHYNSTHVVGTSGGSTDDMKEAITLSATGQLQPSFMVTHIGGLDAVPETVLNLPDIPGGKKLIYNGVTMPLTAIADFAEKGKTDPLFKELARLVEETHGIWNEQAEKYQLAQFGVDIGEAAQ